jgi:rhamnogalacturonan endolyase
MNSLGLAVTATLVLGLSAVPLHGQTVTTGTALVRHAPTVNGTVQGSVQELLAESIALEGGSIVTADLRVPGTPSVVLNGHPTFGGVISGSGLATPTSHSLTLNGNARLGHLVSATNATALSSVAAPPQPTGTRTVVINTRGQAIGSWATLRNLTLNGNVGEYSVPPGTYGDFTANAGAGFTLGMRAQRNPRSTISSTLP